MISTDQHITLCGMMGAGKSAVGRKLAGILGMQFTDLDYHIERLKGRTVQEIFASYGETEFRRIERDCLTALLQSAPAVISLGGGTLQDSTVVDEVKKNSILCFIDPSLDVILKRVLRNKKRPLLLDNKGDLKPEQEIKTQLDSMYRKRLPLYSCAHIRICPDSGNTVAETALNLAKQLKAHAG
jgi:shikimate kinase